MIAKDKIKNELILPHLKSEEELIGFFQATYTPSMWWYFLIGPLSLFAMRTYLIAVTNKGLQFHKFTMWGKPDTYDFFSYPEMNTLKLGSGFLQAPLKVTFVNGRALKLKAQLKGARRVATLDEKTKEYLLSKSG
jgi:hypothetical protein